MVLMETGLYGLEPPPRLPTGHISHFPTTKTHPELFGLKYFQSFQRIELSGLIHDSGVHCYKENIYCNSLQSSSRNVSMFD